MQTLEYAKTPDLVLKSTAGVPSNATNSLVEPIGTSATFAIAVPASGVGFEFSNLLPTNTAATEAAATPRIRITSRRSRRSGKSAITRRPFVFWRTNKKRANQRIAYAVSLPKKYGFTVHVAVSQSVIERKNPPSAASSSAMPASVAIPIANSAIIIDQPNAVAFSIIGFNAKDMGEVSR